MITPSLIKEKNNDISLYLGLVSKSPTVLRKAIVTTPYSAHILFDLWLIMIFNPVANFAQQALHFLIHCHRNFYILGTLK